MNEAQIDLDLGPSVVERLTPHRRPFLFVDRIVGYRHGPRPRLWAERCISANDPVFEGHFPGLSVWPGALTIEGLGQTSTVLSTVTALIGALEARGEDPRVLFDGWHALEQRARFRSHDPLRIDALASSLASLGLDPGVGLGVSVNVKLEAPVFAGQVLRYEVTRTHQMGEIARFDVVACAGDREVARGVMSGCFRGASMARGSEVGA